MRRTWLILICLLIPLSLFHYHKRQSTSPKLYHCFLFNGEYDWLDIQYRTNGHLIDRYIIVESNITFSGKPKPRYLQERLARLPRVLRNKIRLVDPPLIYRDNLKAQIDAWKTEGTAREACREGLDLTSNIPTQLMLISDIDEVVKPELLQDAITDLLNSTHPPPESSIGFICDTYYYNFRWSMGKFAMPVLFNVSFNAIGSDSVIPEPQIQRYWRQAKTKVDSACWHCSYCFGPKMSDAIDTISNKLSSFSHTEFSGSLFRDPERIQQSILNGLDLFREHRPHTALIRTDAYTSAPYTIRDLRRFQYMLGWYDTE